MFYRQNEFIKIKSNNDSAILNLVNILIKDGRGLSVFLHGMGISLDPKGKIILEISFSDLVQEHQCYLLNKKN